MASIEKMAKSLMHELADGKTALAEKSEALLRNQEIIIVQNRNIIQLLENIDKKILTPTNIDETE